MRRLMIAVPIVLVAAGAAAAGWHFLRPRDPLAEARQLQAQGNLRAAQLVLRSAVQADPGGAEAHLRLGQVQLRLGDPTAAERELRIAAEHGWDAHAIRPLLAQAVVGQGRDEEVLRDYAADGLAPDQAAAVLVARAQAQLGLGRADAAAASVSEAQRLAPASVEAALAAAKLAVARKDLVAAERHVGEALAIDPHGLPALMLQAELRAARGDRSGALDSYAAALAQTEAPSQTSAPGAAETVRLGRAGLLVAMGEAAKARLDLDVVLKAQPKQPVAQYLSARLFAQAGDWKAADAALSQVGAVLSRLPGGDLTLAVVKANVGQPEQAIAAAEHLVARAPDDLAAVKLLAKLELSQKEPGKAVEVLAAARDRIAAAGTGTTADQFDAEALDLLGEAYAASGHPADAVAALRQASVIKPDDTRLLTRLAALELRQGDAGQAVQVLGRALDITPAELPPAQPVLAALQTVAPNAAAPTQTSPSQPTSAPTQAQTATALVLAALQAGDIDRAVAGLDRLREAKADPAQLALLGGMVKLAQIDLDGARAAFEEAGRLDPKAVAPRIDLARVLALQGHATEAASLLDGVLATEPAQAAALTALVNLRLQAGQTDQAVAVAEAAQRAAPGDPGILAGLGALYLRTGQPQKTLDLLDAAQRQPGSDKAGLDKAAFGKAGTQAPALQGLRADALLALGRRTEAVQAVREMLAQAPDNATLRRQLVELLAADKQYDEARTVLREGLAQAPGNAALLGASVALAGKEGGPPAAMARAEELARDPANPAALPFPGDLLLSQGHFTEAAAAYRAGASDLAKDDPDAARLTIRAAQALASGGDAGGAANLLRSWLAAHPDSTDIALVLASLDLSANRLPEARAGLEAVLAKQPNNSAALNNLAWIRQTQGDLPVARALAARAYLLAPTPQSADTLGWIVLAQASPDSTSGDGKAGDGKAGDGKAGSRVGDAVALLREAARGQPADPAIQYHLAAALARDGQKAEAVTLLKQVLDKPRGEFGEKPQAVKLLTKLAS